MCELCKNHSKDCLEPSPPDEGGAEVGTSGLLTLLRDIKPQIEARIEGFKNAYPAQPILDCLKENERILNRINLILGE